MILKWEHSRCSLYYFDTVLIFKSRYWLKIQFHFFHKNTKNRFYFRSFMFINIRLCKEDGKVSNVSDISLSAKSMISAPCNTIGCLKAPLTSHPVAARRVSCLCEGGDGADGLGGRKERQESSREAIRERGTAQVSTVRRDINTPNFCSCWICHRIGSEKCLPFVSLARAGPSRPGRCWSTTQRSYLMTIVPPLEALYFLPLPEVRRIVRKL